MLVSIYMPTRNRKTLLAQAVASVLTQTYSELELLVVDDGSSDGTFDFLTQEAAKDSRLKVFRNETSRGAPYSRNLAIAAARGQWITGIDDDDTFHPTRIEAFVAFWRILELGRTKFSCIFSQDVCDFETHTSGTRKPSSIEWTDLFEINGIGNQIFTLTDRLRDVEMFDVDMPAWQDLDLFIRILKRYGSAKLLDSPLYTMSFADRPDRISKQKKERIFLAYERLSQKHPDASRRQIQSLFLQIFGDYYGFRPRLNDVRHFMSYGWNQVNTRRLVKAMLR